jgi:hypothetical protein
VGKEERNPEVTGRTKIALMSMSVIAAVLLLLAVTACGVGPSNIVDGKAKLVTPEGHTCWLLEIDTESAVESEEEGPENYYCVTKAEWDANHPGNQWRTASGMLK